MTEVGTHVLLTFCLCSTRVLLTFLSHIYHVFGKSCEGGGLVWYSIVTITPLFSLLHRDGLVISITMYY